MKTNNLRNYGIAFFVCCFILIAPQTVCAQKPYLFRITRVNGGYITIGGKQLKKWDTFKSDQKIEWKSQDDYFFARPFSLFGKRSKKYKALEFQTKKCESVYAFERDLATRSSLERHVHYSDYDYLLAEHGDTLLVPLDTDYFEGMSCTAIWEDNGKEVKTPITLTADKKFFIISSDVFDNKTPESILLHLCIYIPELDYELNCYERGLHIQRLTMAEKKMMDEEAQNATRTGE